MTDLGPRLLQLKMLLRDVHPAVWRRVRLADELSIAELHRVIQILMGWDDDHLHRFRIHGRDYGIAYIGGPNFGEDAAAVPGLVPCRHAADRAGANDQECAD